MINKKDLIVGKAYKVDGRNLSTAIWDGTVFHGIRTKFGTAFMEEENEYEDGPPHGTCKAIRVLK